MLKQIAFYKIIGKPLFAYFGLAGLLLMLAAVAVPLWNSKRENKIPLHWHMRLGRTAVAVGIIHALLAMSLFF